MEQRRTWPCFQEIPMRLSMLAALFALVLSQMAASFAGTSMAPKTAEIHAKIAVCRKQATAKKLNAKDRAAYIKECVAKPLAIR
jgi:hypothetical protein